VIEAVEMKKMEELAKQITRDAAVGQCRLTLSNPLRNRLELSA